MKTFMFVFAALLLVAGLSFGQVNGTIPINAQLSSTALVVTVNQGLNAVGLSPGNTYYFVPDASADGFVDGGSDAAYTTILGNSQVATVDIVGAPGANVVVSFALPSALVGQTNGGIVHYSTNGTSGCWVSPAGDANLHYFNPTQSQVMALDASGGNAHIALGGIFTVPTNVAPADDYFGDAVITVDYTAN
jgi:hypothetical protein